MAERDMAQGKKVWGMDRNRDAVYQTVSHRTDSHQAGTGDGKETAGKWNIGNRNAGSKTTGLRRRILRSWQLYVLLLPAVVYIAVFAYKPMYGILIAFKDFSIKKGVWGSPWVGFDNFTRLFKSYWFPVILRNTLTISLLNLVLGFPFPILLALLLNEVKNNRFRSAVQTISYAPHFISTVVMCGMLMLFLSPTNGIVNKLLNLLGQEQHMHTKRQMQAFWRRLSRVCHAKNA